MKGGEDDEKFGRGCEEVCKFHDCVLVVRVSKLFGWVGGIG